MQNDTKERELWAEVLDAYLPYRLRRESQSIFRNPDQEWLSDEVYNDPELAALLSDALLSVTQRFQRSLQAAEAIFQAAVWRFCSDFYGLKRGQIVEFGAIERERLKIEYLCLPNNDGDFGEIEAHGFIVSGDEVVTSRKFWFRLDLIPWWHIDNELQIDSKSY